MKVNINELNMDLQTRAETNGDVVAEYAAQMREGTVYDPVTVFRESPEATPVWLVDGFHRVAAYREVGVDEIEAHVVYGNRSAALTHALKANAKHGLRRSNADKRHALETAWENRFELFPGLAGQVDENGNNRMPSSTQLAAICGVSQAYACNFINNLGSVKRFTPPSSEEPSEEAVTKRLNKGMDRFFVEIPEHLQAVFRDRLANELSGLLKAALKRLHASVKDGNVAVMAYAQLAEIDIQKSLDDIAFGRPYCVCPACAGRPGGCNICSGLGFVTRNQYRRIPSDFKHEPPKRKPRRNAAKGVSE